MSSFRRVGIHRFHCTTKCLTRVPIHDGCYSIVRNTDRTADTESYSDVVTQVRVLYRSQEEGRTRHAQQSGEEKGNTIYCYKLLYNLLFCQGRFQSSIETTILLFFTQTTSIMIQEAVVIDTGTHRNSPELIKTHRYSPVLFLYFPIFRLATLCFS
jgi:hypothetical protein